MAMGVKGVWARVIRQTSQFGMGSSSVKVLRRPDFARRSGSKQNASEASRMLSEDMNELEISHGVGAVSPLA
jgi:hypothetical protein